MADTEPKKEEEHSRKDRPTGSMHVGDVDFDPEDPAFIQDATWGEVLQACCVHSPAEWGTAFLGLCMVCFFLYFFLVGLDFLGTGAKVMSSCAAGALFGDETNPVAGLMVGILATVLLQSSSTTTSLVVSLVGAETVSVKQGIYMVMGANIGTSVTNTIVACGHLGDGDQLERAFAGATVHDMFNFMTVAILMPVEVITGYLYHFTYALAKNYTAKDGEEWDGPIKTLVEPIGKKVIIENKSVTKHVAAGGTCDYFYPINCTDPSNPTKSTCKGGLIGCDKKTGKCPAFYQPEADQSDDVMSGIVVFIIGIAMLFFCLGGLVHVLQKMLLGTSTRIIYKATNVNGYVAMVIGMGITMLVQSSSVTTSSLTPLVGMGVLRLEQMLPLTLGANIGTTLTGILAALLSNSLAMQVALAHLFFNITGIIIWYPLPFMRAVPLHAARQLGRGTRLWSGFPLLYIAVMFVAVPALFMGLSALFTQDSKGLTVLGSFLTVILGLVVFWLVYYCQFQGGKENCVECMTARQTRVEAISNLPEDMIYLKNKIKELAEHTGLPEDEEAPAKAEEEPKAEEAVEEETA